MRAATPDVFPVIAVLNLFLANDFTICYVTHVTLEFFIQSRDFQETFLQFVPAKETHTNNNARLVRSVACQFNNEIKLD
jgi:hypothetical protein